MIDSAASTTTLYYYNPDWQVLAEYDGSNGLQRYFVYGNYIDEPLAMHRQSDGKDYYYGHDHLYSTVVVIDDTGSVVERCEYDAYGTVNITDASYNPRTASAYGNPYTFTSRRLDVLDSGELLRMHYRHRDYDVYAGRFLQHDPLGIDPAGKLSDAFVSQYQDGLLLLGYAKSNPVSYVDPLGLEVPGLHVIVDGLRRGPRSGTCGCSAKREIGNAWHKTIDCGEFGRWGYNLGGTSGPGTERPGDSEYNEEVALEPPYRQWPLFKRRWGRLGYGQAAGESCCKATCDAIISCLTEFARDHQRRHAAGEIRYTHGIIEIVNGRPCDRIWPYTCVNFVGTAIGRCCLRQGDQYIVPQ